MNITRGLGKKFTAYNPYFYFCNKINQVETLC